ncbi:sialate O-acetylesterase [Jejuia spongiicola]|uniref:Sialate O-acetylesterase n=1 Tax=Jejuia spongiicola TaxID=2942207 RepID=A0ABT0QJB8_9FLAO|nr:sialate O-acetylesterase [Jejuia spongiicola]MCL6296573.1 sialate O-acetylesterase [Jejuia spongiicola]
MNPIRLNKIWLLIIIVQSIFTYGQKKEVIRVYYLGGQSNMDGFGYNDQLPNSFEKSVENIWIFHGNPVGDNETNGGLGKWNIMQPGHGYGFSADQKGNNLSDRFGLELSFGKRLQELYPNDKIAIIKYSRGGTSIDSLAAGEYGSWEPDYRGTNGLNQYDHFLNTIRSAFSKNDIDSNGIADLFMPSGIIWMQGESDAYYTEEIALRYYPNLRRLLNLIRASLLKDDLPVVIGKISDSGQDTDGKVWNYCELVQHAQEKYVRIDENSEIVRTTANYNYSDAAHYNSEGYIDLGKKMAEAIYNLENQIESKTGYNEFHE